MVQGILKDWDVQGVLLGQSTRASNVPDGGDEGSYTTASFKDNFASDLVYEHCLRVQLDYLQTLEARTEQARPRAGRLRPNDGTYSCDSSATFAKIVMVRLVRTAVLLARRHAPRRWHAADAT